MEQTPIGEVSKNRFTKKGINAAALKMIAVISMTIYSIENSIIDRLMIQKALPQSAGAIIYYIFLILGVPSFILFTFLLTEGFEHTSSRKNYVLRLLGAAVISELPFDLFYSGTGNMLLQNIIFSYLIAFLTLWGIDSILKKYKPAEADMPGMNKGLTILLVVLTALAGIILSEVIRGFFGCMIVGLALIFYFFKNNKAAMFAGGALTFCAGYIITDTLSYALSRISEIKINHIVKYSFTFSDFINRLRGSYNISLIVSIGALLGLLLLLFYNGKKGYPQPKIFYYIYFPVHMLLLVFVYFMFSLVMGWI